MIPQPIYEILPYLYMLAGLIALFSLDNILGKLCGAILIIAGVIVQQVRARVRGKKPVRPKSAGRDPSSGRPVADSGRDPRSGRSAANSGREPASRRSMPDRPSRRP